MISSIESFGFFNFHPDTIMPLYINGREVKRLLITAMASLQSFGRGSIRLYTRNMRPILIPLQAQVRYPK